MLSDTMVDAFVVATKYYEVTLHRKVVGYMLIKLLTVRRSEYHLVVVALSLQCRDTAVDRLTLHHHASKATIRIVVYTLPFVESVVAKVVEMNFGKSFFLSSCQYRLVEEVLKHFGQHGYNIYSHIVFILCILL